MTIVYTVVGSPLGRMLVAATERGVSAVYLGESDAPLEAALREEYPRAQIHRDANGLGKWVSAILHHLKGGAQKVDAHQGAGSTVSAPAGGATGGGLGIHNSLDLPLDVQATAFQKRVWDALRTIPYGTTKTYSQIAKSLGQPQASRAVARACATNPVSIVVPCHRVVREDGNLAGYRWGLARKQSLLDHEQAAMAKQAPSRPKPSAKARVGMHPLPRSR
jgi:AraC family transcriptional regulator of adaptative response/methylated-DNA-[protein]-cysteine methyltransferase